MAKVSFLSPKFSTKEIAQWLSENISPGSDVPYYSSYTSCRALYSADNRMWSIEVTGGGCSGQVRRIEVDLPEQFASEVRRKFTPIKRIK